MRKTGYFIFTILLCLSFNMKAQRGGAPNTTPEEAYQRAINNPAFTTSAKGEGFCWQARGGLDQFSRGYEAT